MDKNYKILFFFIYSMFLFFFKRGNPLDAYFSRWDLPRCTGQMGFLRLCIFLVWFLIAHPQGGMADLCQTSNQVL